MGFWSALVMVVFIIFGSIFGPAIIRELRRGFGEPVLPQRGEEGLERELGQLRREIVDIRTAYTDKMLSLEKSLKELRKELDAIKLRAGYSEPPLTDEGLAAPAEKHMGEQRGGTS